MTDLPTDPAVLRNALGWTQSQAARHCGISQPAISAVEHGRASQRQVEDVRNALTLALVNRREAATEREAAERIESLASAVPGSPEWQALRAAIKDRALDYLERCHPVACDALLEMIPRDEAVALLDEYLDLPRDTATAPAPVGESAVATSTPVQPPSIEAPGMTPSDPTVLADRIDAFIERYARIRRSYVPGEDDPEERFNGPDSSMLASAAQLIRRGETPHSVHSTWSMSGCYKEPSDPAENAAAKAEHDDLVTTINALARVPTSA